MKTLFKTLLIASIIATINIATGLAADSHDYQLGNLHIGHPFARATAGPARAGAAYLTIENSGEADRLIAAATDKAAKVELHTMEMADGIMRMREVAGGIAVPANGSVTLEPGGLHIMLLGLTGPLVEGTRFPMTLTFEQAGTVDVEIMVHGVSAGAGGDDHQDHKGHGDKHDAKHGDHKNH